VVAMIPPAVSVNPALIAVKVVGGSAVLVGIGLVFYFFGRAARSTNWPNRRGLRDNSDT